MKTKQKYVEALMQFKADLQKLDPRTFSCKEKLIRNFLCRKAIEFIEEMQKSPKGENPGITRKEAYQASWEVGEEDHEYWGWTGPEALDFINQYLE